MGRANLRLAPVPFESALEDEAGSAIAEVEAEPEVDAESGTGFPIAAEEELMNLGLEMGRDVNAFDFSVIFDGRGETFAFPAN